MGHQIKNYIARRDRKRVLLDAAEATYEKLLANPKKSFSFDTGNGRISASHRDLEAIAKSIQSLESEIDRLNRKIYGGTLVNHSLRRNW